MSHILQWLPPTGRPEQLMLLLHGVGANGAGMQPLADWLRREFPQAAIVAPDGFEPLDGDPSGRARQWFSRLGVTEANRAERIAAALPPLAAWVQQVQQDLGLGPAATALVGFSQGAIMSLALAQAHDGIAGRVLAFAGRYAELPTHAPEQTTLHFFHGGADEVVPAQHSRDAIQRLADLHGDATIDIAEGLGHEINAALLQRAVFRLRNHIPQRTWAAAMGQVPGLGERLPRGGEDDEIND
ncbi:MAG: esterase [Vitreoscilla sp.]|nr:esterase [Vitreoscilla sp.]MBP6674495.1 esterase [Vitreoscilla sp.]